MSRSLVLLLLASLASRVAAQGQGVLVNGNSNLPACAQTCQALQQAAQACSGTTSASQSTWVCFCQSAYLTSLKTAGSTLCSASCSSTADNNQISTWYNTNCGNDYGASEHSGDSSAATTTAAAGGAGASSTSAAAPGATSTASSSSGSNGDENGNNNFSAGINQTGQGWWSSHYKYIIMLIILVIALPLLAWLAIWLKRRHDRKMDQMNEGFNSGITHRPAPAPMSDPNLSGGAGSGIDGSGRNSPARTRDAFMPYGYGYNRSESQVGSKHAMYEDRRSPLARGEYDPEKEAGIGAGEEPTKKSKRVLVRERSTENDIQREKR